MTFQQGSQTVTNHDRIRRKQLLTEAEGYLDLVTVFADKWTPSQAVRDPILNRALEALKELETSGMSPGRVRYLKGQALSSMERYEDAITPLVEAADIDNENIHIWLALGWCYKRIGRLDLAIESLEEALAIDPDEAIIHYNLACYWSLAKNSQLAIAYLASALDVDPNFRDLISGEADFDNVRHHPDFLTLTTVIV